MKACVLCLATAALHLQVAAGEDDGGQEGEWDTVTIGTAPKSTTLEYTKQVPVEEVPTPGSAFSDTEVPLGWRRSAEALGEDPNLACSGTKAVAAAIQGA